MRLFRLCLSFQLLDSLIFPEYISRPVYLYPGDLKTSQLLHYRSSRIFFPDFSVPFCSNMNYNWNDFLCLDESKRRILWDYNWELSHFGPPNNIT
ncbi:unnamed protein product [Blepharisma stoltei]|uniref:Uncharacterized protein n=1 Tax=Blepharisma stoltei TaxID=1481888 RepID=A0AAU9IWS9_9CILI|nr:unnamed protein product [Blepharisma stoltei]